MTNRNYKTPATSANDNKHEVGEDPAFPEGIE